MNEQNEILRPTNAELNNDALDPVSGGASEGLNWAGSWHGTCPKCGYENLPAGLREKIDPETEGRLRLNTGSCSKCGFTW